MSKVSYSPLAEIIECETYPNARTLRTTFFKKLWDSFYVLAGKYSLNSNKHHYGIFDYLTLFIPAGILNLSCFLQTKVKSTAVHVLFIPGYLMNIPFLVARVAFSAVASLVFSPVTAIVHCFSLLFSSAKKREALRLEGKTYKGKTKSLEQYLSDNNMDIESLNISLKKATQDKKIRYNNPPEIHHATNGYKLTFWKKQTGSSMCEGCMDGGCGENHEPEFSVEIRKDNLGAVNQAKNIHALFSLNVGSVVSYIENDHSLSSKEVLAIK